MSYARYNTRCLLSCKIQKLFVTKTRNFANTIFIFFFFFFLLGPILTDNLWNLPAVMFFSCFNSDEELSCQS